MAHETQDSDFLAPRKDRLLREHVHDTYKSRSKLTDPTACPRCGAVYHEGRWQWISKPPDAHSQVCPACHRIADKYPAGSVALSGRFLEAHKQELLNIVHNQEALEKAEHPLARLIDVVENQDGILVTTTDPHLARRIGEALHRACAGELEFHYVEESNLLRVGWSR